ncbi:MAG: ECF transporter S component [Coriobacteriales bacterium]|nr:ECF transporter S component [Coriobacteriales bacterium]
MSSPNYYLLALGVILVALVLMVVRFEGRKPRAREVVVLAVMTALAVAGRAAFFMLPQFKPVAAIVIITGVALGAESGFLVGALAAFLSNFIFGQGPWTPFQMFAFGLIGFVAGLLFHRQDRGMQWGVAADTDSSQAASYGDVGAALSALGRSKRGDFARILMLCIYGGLSVTVLYGLIVDILYMLMFSESVSVSALAAILASGLPFNVIHGIATVFFLAVLAHPMIEKLERIKIKFGLMGVCGRRAALPGADKSRSSQSL